MSSAEGTAPQVWIDDRYHGAHGIGRYAYEVSKRLTMPWSPLRLGGAPAQPLDFLRRVPAAARHGLVYSPGYGALVSAKRQILTVHDLIHLQVAWPGRAKYLAYYNGVVRPVVRRNRIVITVSETSRREIQEWLGDESVDVVNAGIGCSDAFTLAGDSASSDDPYAMYVGNLRAHKNLDVVLRALGSVTDLKLVLVLPPAEHDEVRARVHRLGLDARVRTTADIDDRELARLYRGAMVTVFPSKQEGFGLPALESIMCGTPVIYWAGCDAVAETVGRNGRAVADADDPSEWASALIAERETTTSVVAPSERYDWSRTAGLINATLLRC